MKNFDCYEFCNLDPHRFLNNKLLFVKTTKPTDDYFNDNLDEYFDEDDFYDYSHDLRENIDLEEKAYTHTHQKVHH